FSGSASTKEDLLAALRQFKAELESARQQGLPETTADDVLVEIEAAELEASKPAPLPERIVKRLESASKALTAGAGLATATAQAAEAANKLVPFLQQVTQHITKFFGG
ncbi:MAG TPA: hypothetical protein VFQ47_09520, partial [Nitrososphaera sp.]|nr:hypothetical protein [Nitrososphaera sp.]